MEKNKTATALLEEAIRELSEIVGQIKIKGATYRVGGFSNVGKVLCDSAINCNKISIGVG